MPYHDWSDDKVDWEAINAAATFIGYYCSKYGRMRCHTKEKYGCVRAYVGFHDFTLHHLIYPQHVWFQFRARDRVLDNRFKRMLQYVNVKFWEYFAAFDHSVFRVVFCFMNKPYLKWQLFIYNRAYQLAIKKWPHILQEIIHDADYPEYIKNYDKMYKEDETLKEDWDTDVTEPKQE